MYARREDKCVVITGEKIEKLFLLCRAQHNAGKLWIMLKKESFASQEYWESLHGSPYRNSFKKKVPQTLYEIDMKVNQILKALTNCRRYGGCFTFRE